MKPILSFLLSALLTLTLTSCQEEPTTLISPEGQNLSLEKLTLPSGATLDYAKLWIYSIREPKGNTTYAHKVTSNWQECEVTWNSFNNGFSPTVVGSFPNVLPAGWKSITITSLVNGWISGTITNYGVLIKENLNDPGYIFERSQYHSLETNYGFPPYLEICYTINGQQYCDTTRAIADVHMWQAVPDNNYCLADILVTGARVIGQEEISLLKFDLEISGDGCTRTQIYWKRHTQYGPKQRDANWNLIQPNEENTIFFSSGKSYYQVLYTHPIGNAYYFLAKQYIASKLNLLSGASIPAEVQTAFDNATALFNTYTPAQIGGLRFFHPIRVQFRQCTFKLRAYNWGIIGPGRCGS